MIRASAAMTSWSAPPAGGIRVAERVRTVAVVLTSIPGATDTSGGRAPALKLRLAPYLTHSGAIRVVSGRSCHSDREDREPCTGRARAWPPATFLKHDLVRARRPCSGRCCAGGRRARCVFAFASPGPSPVVPHAERYRP